jgi:AcrR family transcriptional regulator
MKSASRTYTQTQRAESTLATRDRLLGAATAAFSASVYEDVTLAAIAKEAGVSHQTLLNHFESKEGLFAAVVEDIKESIVDRRAAVQPGSVARVVGYLMEQYEEIGDVNARYSMTADRFPLIADAMNFGRASHREWLELQLGERLPRRGRERERALSALHAATDVYTWKLLRRDIGLSLEETAATMTMLVEGVLRPGGGTSGR